MVCSSIERQFVSTVLLAEISISVILHWMFGAPQLTLDSQSTTAVDGALQIPDISNPSWRGAGAVISSIGRPRSHSLSSRTSRARRNDVSILSTRPSMRWFLPRSAAAAAAISLARIRNRRWYCVQSVGCKIKRGRHGATEGHCTRGRSPVPVIGDEPWKRHSPRTACVHSDVVY